MIKLGDKIVFTRLDLPLYSNRPTLRNVYTVVDIRGDDVYLTTPSPLWINFTKRSDIAYRVLNFDMYYGEL